MRQILLLLFLVTVFVATSAIIHKKFKHCPKFRCTKFCVRGYVTVGGCLTCKCRRFKDVQMCKYGKSSGQCLRTDECPTGYRCISNPFVKRAGRCCPRKDSTKPTKPAVCQYGKSTGRCLRTDECPPGSECNSNPFVKRAGHCCPLKDSTTPAPGTKPVCPPVNLNPMIQSVCPSGMPCTTDDDCNQGPHGYIRTCCEGPCGKYCRS